jgi:hypothetical protein
LESLITFFCTQIILLYQLLQVVTTFEQVFDRMLEVHAKISHARDPESNKKCINDDLGYYGVPVEAVKYCIETYP